MDRNRSRMARKPGNGSWRPPTRLVALAATGAFLGGCNRSIEGDLLLLRHAKTTPDTGWIRLDKEKGDQVRSLLTQASYRRQVSTSPSKGSDRWLRLQKDDTTIWEGAYVAPGCVASDTDAYCVPADDSDAQADLREIFR